MWDTTVGRGVVGSVVVGRSGVGYTRRERRRRYVRSSTSHTTPISPGRNRRGTDPVLHYATENCGGFPPQWGRVVGRGLHHRVRERSREVRHWFCYRCRSGLHPSQRPRPLRLSRRPPTPGYSIAAWYGTDRNSCFGSMYLIAVVTTNFAMGVHGPISTDPRRARSVAHVSPTWAIHHLETGVRFVVD